MKKKIMLIISIILIIFIVSGCKNNKLDEEQSKNYINKIEKLNEQINIMQAENNEMRKLLNVNKAKEENFYELSYISLDFVRAQTTGDIEKLNTLLSDDLEAIQKANYKYIVTDKIEWLLYHESFGEYKDMLIQSYKYDSESDIYKINIREFYTESNGELKTPPTYIDLYFKKINDEWKIVDVEFDV